MRFAGKSARMTTAFAKVGFSGDFGSHYFLHKLVGTAKARELYFTAEILNAEQIEKLGDGGGDKSTVENEVVGAGREDLAQVQHHGERRDEPGKRQGAQRKGLHQRRSLLAGRKAEGRHARGI